MDKIKRLTYIAASKWGVFLDYQKDHPNINCEYISSITFLEGRVPAEILTIDSLEMRWDGIGIYDSIDRFKMRHEEFFAEKNLEEELKEVGLTEDDLELGV